MNRDGMLAPWASICIPTFNGGLYLGPAIESALSQSLADTEILIVDDGSTDQSVDIAERYARSDSRIRVHRNARSLGLPGNWNRCVNLARGTWIKFLFQDDVLSQRCLERLQEAVRGDVDLVVCRRTAVAEPGLDDNFAHEYAAYTAAHDFARRFPDTTFVAPERFAEHVVDHPIANCIGEPSATLVRRSAFDRFGQFHPDLRQLVDWEHAARIAVQTGISYLDEPLVTIRLHASMASVRQTRDSRFRTDVLDPLIVLHELAYSPAFESVRLVGRRRPVPVVFEELLRREAQAVRDATCRLPDALSSSRQQWRDLVDRYPKLAPASTHEQPGGGSLAMAALRAFLRSGARLRFTKSEAPVISAILVVRNRPELALRALYSLLPVQAVPLEVLVVDNASSDDTTDMLARCDDVTVIRNHVNVGFGPAVNQACQAARGRHLLLLNSDAELLAGSVPSALRTIEEPRVGAVGGRLILEDGRLQEAGSIVWRDGSSSGYGRGDAPFAPMYSFERDVDYCSAAALLTPRQTFVDLGGFDAVYAPAYYEDVDYCFKLRAAGLRVVYDPAFIARHTEFGSSRNEDALARQARNRAIFVQRHAETLVTRPEPETTNVLAARMVASPGLRILHIDDQVPRDSFGAGLPRARQLIRALVDQGHFLTVYPLVVTGDESTTWGEDIPRTVEVMFGYGPERLGEFLASRAGYYDRIIVSRPHNYITFRSAIGALTGEIVTDTIIYDAEAIFAQRDVELARLRGASASSSGERLEAELSLAATADVVISVSDEDRVAFVKAGCRSVITVAHSIEPWPTPASFGERSGFLFVGPTHDDWSPNTDAVSWFVAEILPAIDCGTGGVATLTVVGRTGAARLASVEGPRVRMTGPLPDLSSIYNTARVFVAPIRAAAGISHKAHHAAAHGVPIVSSPIVADQLGWRDEQELLVAGDAEGFARQCGRLYRDPDLWRRLRENALEKVRTDCSPEKFVKGLQAAIAIRARTRPSAGPAVAPATGRVQPRPVAPSLIVPPVDGRDEVLSAARREIAELRGSMSWRVTAPLRLVYGLLLKAIR